MKETIDLSKLVSEATDGSEAAFDEIYRHTYKTAYHSASLLLKNHDDIEDVLQNVYIKAYKKLSELKNPESLEGWIKSIVENECKNYIKKENRIHAPLVFFKNKEDENSLEWKQPVPEEYMEREDLRECVNDILDTLSPEVRACIVLFYYEDKSLNEISQILDIPLGTVKTRLFYGKKRIEKQFDKLRKKDPTLFGIGAIPALLALFSYRAKNSYATIVVPKLVMPSVAGTTAATGTAAVVSATTASAAATSGVTTTAAVSIATKVAAVAVAGSVAVGGSIAIKNEIDINKEKTVISSVRETEDTSTIAHTVTTQPTTEETVKETTFFAGTQTRPNTTISGTTTAKAVTSTRPTSLPSVASTTRQTQTTEQATTTQATTTKPTTTTTTKASTTREETTTRPTTTMPVETGTTPTTTRPTTTVPTTASPESYYAASGGVITGYSGSDRNVSIPSSIGTDTVTAVGAGAFSGNTEIVSVSLPSTVTQIGQEAFSDCTSLTSVSLPSSLESVGMGAFYGCSNLTSVNIPNGTQTIGDEAFAYCDTLSTITIPSSVTSISSDAFDGCDSVVIRCAEGSEAHNYAVNNGIDFSLI